MLDIEGLAAELAQCVERKDFNRAFQLLQENHVELEGKLQPLAARDALKKTTDDRLLLSFLDSVEFGSVPLKKSLARLEKLLGFQLGAKVLSDAWGLGIIRKLDYFYRRITVDFNTRKGHQFTYAAAIDMLNVAPEDHVLVIRQGDPQRIETMIREQPADFIKLVLKSYGDMTVVKLEDTCVKNGFVKSVNWKKFWDGARAELRRDKLVVIPAKRTDPISLKPAEEEYGEVWLTAFSHETEPKLILAGVREYVSKKDFNAADESVKTKIGERLSFAATAACKTDDALYARIACQIVRMGFLKPSAEEMRAYLRERRRYIKAAAALPSREVGEMIRFLADSDEAKARLYESLPDLCFAAVEEVVANFGDEPACRQAVGKLLKSPKAPATLVTLVIGHYEKFREKNFCDWKELPPLITILNHAIALGEGRQSGETLKMQNLVRRLFGDRKWLEMVFSKLKPDEQVMFFERFQASIAWDPATHNATVVRMSKMAPGLEQHIVKVEKKREYARLTSYRSFALKKAEYLKLINEDMPANVKRIEFAKSYGDLSENAEYQYAKDEQRALMQKQTLMQSDLEAVKPGDFADATTDEVMPGVIVIAEATENDNKVQKRWVILGEWDSDQELGVLSSKTRIAQNLMGKKVGDNFELPTADGGITFAKVVEILPLTDEIREWMKVPAGMQI